MHKIIAIPFDSSQRFLRNSTIVWESDKSLRDILRAHSEPYLCPDYTYLVAYFARDYGITDESDFGRQKLYTIKSGR